MALRLNGQTSGYVELEAPATAGSNTLTLPNGNGSSGQYLQTNGSGGLSWQTVPAGVDGYTWTSMQTFSGSNAVEILGIPDGTNRIVVVFNKVTWVNLHNNAMQFNVGQVNIDTTNSYTWGLSHGTSQQQATSPTSYMRVLPSTYQDGTNTMTGQIFITRLTTNMFVINGVIGDVVNSNVSCQSNGVYEGADEINKIRFTCNSGNYDGGRMIVGYA